MEVGISKKEGLFSKFKGLQEGNPQGPVNTQRSWSDFETAPLIKEPLLKGVNANVEVKSRLVSPTTRRLEDVARITKLMAEPGGIRWLAHTAEMETIQRQLDVKRAGGEKNFKSLMTNIGMSLIDTAGLTVSTLAQVALTGTGEHQTPFLSRAYLHKGGKGKVIGKILAEIGIGDGDYVNGGALALKGKEIIGSPALTLISPKNSGYRRDGNEAIISEIPSSSLTRDWETVKTEVHTQDTRTWNDEKPYRGEQRLLESRSKVSDTTEVTSESQTILSPVSLLPVSGESLDSTYEDKDTFTLPTTGEALQVSYTDRDGKSQQYHASSSVRQKNRIQSVEFSNREGALNSGFGIQEQFYTSSDESTTYVGWMKAKEPEKPYDVSDRVRGIVDSNTTKQIGKRTYTIPLRNKPSNSEKYTVRSTAESAQFVYGQGHDEQFFRKLGLIPFEISSITPEQRYYMAFEANLDSIKDNFTGNWNSVQYVGRAENFYGYSGFDRQIDFSFKVVASREEYLKDFYQKLNKLAAVTAPSYASNGVFMRGTLASVTIGDYFRNLKGFIKSVSFSWNTDYVWEIDTESLRVPHMLDVSVTFTPIHDFIPDSIGDGNLHYFGDRTDIVSSPDAKISTDSGDKNSAQSGFETEYITENLLQTPDIESENNFVGGNKWQGDLTA